jgi:hypothetical protein
MSMQASSGDHPGTDQLERELRRVLFRFDCPDAHTLGEYQLDLLDAEARTRVAAHAAECDECRAELQMARSFLAEPLPVSDSVLTRARRMVATLFTPNPRLAYGGLRGAADSATRIFEAGDVTVTLAPGQTSNSIFGLVVSSHASAESLTGREARLVPRDGAAVITALDDLGNFELNDLAAGLYALEIDLPDGVVVIEELRVT